MVKIFSVGCNKSLTTFQDPGTLNKNGLSDTRVPVNLIEQILSFK